jgi:hypothetical protein
VVPDTLGELIILPIGLVNIVWMGYKSAKLIARLKGINLYIWTQSTKVPDAVELRESTESARPTNTIHMLHTSGFTHFNLLSESNFKPCNDPKIPAQLMETRDHKNERLPEKNKSQDSPQDKPSMPSP